MGRRGLVIALASFGVIVLGAVVVWAIIWSGTPSAAPSPEPTQPVPSETASPEPSGTPTPSVTPTASPSAEPEDPAPAAVTALAAKPAPHAVRLDWKNPADDDLRQLFVVQSAGATPPVGISSGTVIAKLDFPAASYTDKGDGLKAGKKYSYAVFVRDAAGGTSPASGVTVTVPAALTVTPVDVTGEVTQQLADGALTDAGSLAFTAFTPSGTRIAAVLPAAGVAGKVTRILTEPAGAAPGAVAWTYTVQNAVIRSLAEGAKRDELFVIELRDGTDKVRTTVTVTVTGINDAPVVAAPMPNQAAIAGQPFTFPIPPGTFVDVDAADTLVLSAGSLPAWLSLTDGQLLGNPAGSDTGTSTVTITATDPHGASVSADVAIEVAVPLPAPNQPPAPGADAVTFDLGVDPLQTSAGLLGNDSDPDNGPNALAAIPASGEWQVGGQLAGGYSIDAAGTLHLDSGVLADGPLQTLGAGEQATATISYAVTDGTDTAQSTVEVTVIGAASKAGEYDVAKVFVPVTEPARELGRHIHG